MDKIRFKDLSKPLKIGMIAAYVLGVFYAIVFLFGFASIF